MIQPKLLFAALAASSIWSTAMADSPSKESGNNDKSPDVARVVLRHYKGTTIRPNAPSRLTLECLYGDGFIEPIFPNGTQTLSVRVYNDVEEWSDVVSVTNPILRLPVLAGEYRVECIDDSNRSFHGFIEY